MDANAELRDRVLEIIRTGELPDRSPERTWAGPGCGAPCVICGQRVSSDELEFSAPDADNPREDFQSLMPPLPELPPIPLPLEPPVPV